MIEFFREAIAPLNLPFTGVLCLLMLYWIFVIIGAADMDFMPDVDDGGGLFDPLFHFLGFSEAPFMAVVTILVTAAWAFSMLANFIVNPGKDLIMGVLLLVPNILFTVFITKLIMLPVRKITREAKKQEEDRQQVLYREGEVITSEVTSGFGQVEIETGGAPIRINARTTGEPLKKGDKVIVYDKDEEKGIYFVEKQDSDI